MKKSFNKRIATLVMLLFTTVYGYSQSTNKVDESQVESLISKKIAMDKDGDFKDRYTIQIFYGGYEAALKVKNAYAVTGLKWRAKQEWNKPNMKIWVGNFASRIEADRALIEVKKKYPNAFILKP